ncbi:pyroglutamyl-peptidase I [bacterium]|nr:pyroglutamyl-peptidase I [bacterium]
MAAPKPQPRFLLTGFGPFPGVEHNPTQAVVERLNSCGQRKGCELHCLVLPTEYGRAGGMVEEAIARLRPAYVLCLGVARSEWIRPERIARNLDSAALPDAAGAVQQGPIVPEGREQLRSSLELPAIRAMLLKAGFSVKYSDDAGGYLCNHVFYRACAAAARLKPRPRCGFIHVPPESALPALQLEKAVRIMIRASLIADGHLKATAT